MPKLDLSALPVRSGSGYLPPFDGPVLARSWRAVAAAGGLCQFGAKLVTLESGAWSSQRHWHTHEDEMLVMLAGEAVLVEENAETLFTPGDIACFPAGIANGHHLQNRSALPCHGGTRAPWRQCNRRGRAKCAGLPKGIAHGPYHLRGPWAR